MQQSTGQAASVRCELCWSTRVYGPSIWFSESPTPTQNVLPLLWHLAQVALMPVGHCSSVRKALGAVPVGRQEGTSTV